MAIASWLTPASKSGTGNKTVGLTASKNPGASRTTIVTVTVRGITKTINCTQTEQDKFTLNVSSTTLNSSGTAITNIGECSIGSTSSAGVSTGTYYRDTSQTITAKAAPTGYSFIGWYEGSNLISSSLQVSVTMSANRTLVAKYQIKSYVVNAISDDTTKGIVSPAGQTVEHGKNATVTASRKTGYKFNGWYNGTTKVTSANPYTFAPTANITLTAKWSVYNITIPVNVSPTGAGTTSPSPFTGQEGSTVNITATPATGYKFAYWTDGVDDTHYVNNPQPVAMLSVKTLTAYFTLKSYIVTWNANGGTVSPASTTKTHGSTLGTLPTPTRASTAEYSYTFAGWFTATSGGTQISSTTTVTGNVTYYAHWTATKRSYTATFNGNGGSTPSPSSITKEYNTALGTLPTCTRTGYTFLGWYTASSGGTKISTTTVVTKDITYYAQWSINSYTLTFNPNGGTVTPTSKDLEYNSAYGTLPTPTRASDEQYTYTFAGWYTAATGGTQVTATTKMAAKDTTVYAHWTFNTRSYTVSYKTTYGTLNKTSQSVAYNSKGSCTLTMPNNTAEFTYTFVGWYTAANGGGTKVGSELTLETPAITGTVTYYAYVTRSTKSYTHTFNSNGGGTVSPSTITKAYNTALGTLPTVSRTGYTFVGWFDTSAASGGTQATTTTKVTGIKTWYARWSINSYTFTFDKNGGNTPSATTITKEYNTAIGTLPTCTRSADNTYTYAFAGWFDTSASSGGTKLTTTTKVTSNKTWYARWTSTYKNYTVTWDGNGGTPSKSSSSFHYNDALGTLPTATRTGYKFKGWSTSKTGTVNVSTTTKVTANVTYYAVWTINSYTWTFDANGGTGDTTKTLNYNATLSTLPTASRASTAANNYTFAGWFDTDASTGGTQLTTSTKCTGNKTWYARWTSTYKNYTVTWDGNGGTPSKSSSSFHYNDALGTLPTATRTGYKFKGWSTSKTGTVNVSTTTKVTANVTYYAVWTINSYTWTFDANGGTGDTTKTLNYNATLSTLPTASRASTAANNYTFAGWFDTDASTGGTQLTTSTKCTGNKTWYARWTISTRQYKLTVTAGTGGKVSGGGTYNYNASVTLKATANSGYHFVKWSDGNTSATRTVTVTKNATYTATFEQDPYLNLDKTSLTFEASGGTQTVKVTSNVNWTVS